MKPIAHISKPVIDALNLDIAANTPVYVGESNFEHIKRRHPYEYDKYITDIMPKHCIFSAVVMRNVTSTKGP